MPSGATIDGSTGIITFTIPFTSQDYYSWTVRFVARNGYSGVFFAQSTIIVNDPNELEVVVLTQAEYNGLGVYDDNTYYLING